MDGYVLCPSCDVEVDFDFDEDDRYCYPTCPECNTEIEVRICPTDWEYDITDFEERRRPGSNWSLDHATDSYLEQILDLRPGSGAAARRVLQNRLGSNPRLSDESCLAYYREYARSD